MGVPTFLYSPSCPEGRIFDSDDVSSLGPEWVDHPGLLTTKAENRTGPDLSASDSTLSGFSKRALEEAARDQLGIELDRRKGIRKLIADIRAAQE